MPARILLLLLAAVTLASCGDDTAGDGGTAPGADAGAFPASLKNQLGSVEIPAPPKRVVALDVDSADAAIALGVTPVGMAEVSYAPDKVRPWTQAALGGKQVQLFPYTDGPPFEQIAALRPDVILAVNTYGLDEHYAKLSKIAPVVATVGDEGTDRWQTSTLRVGRAVGREDAARRLVADTEARVRAVRKANPAFDGKTFTFFNLYEGDAWVITRADASIRFLEQLGFRLSPKIAPLEGDQGRAAVGSERFDLLEADVLIGTTPTPGTIDDLRETATFKRLDVVQRGAFVELDLATAASIAFPSALSVRWGLKQIVPKLATALERER